MINYFKKLLSPKSGTNFQKGDKVEAFGCKGIVKGYSVNNLYVEVNFPEFPHSVVSFHPDGKLSQWHKVPSLRKF